MAVSQSPNIKDLVPTDSALFDIIITDKPIVDEEDIRFADFTILTTGYSIMGLDNQLFLMTNTLESAERSIESMSFNLPDSIRIFIITYDRYGAIIDSKKFTGRYVNKFPFADSANNIFSWTMMFKLEDWN